MKIQPGRILAFDTLPRRSVLRGFYPDPGLCKPGMGDFGEQEIDLVPSEQEVRRVLPELAFIQAKNRALGPVDHGFLLLDDFRLLIPDAAGIHSLC